jgi:DNA helicase-2/ATP-dependent DNA helicase PcrA
VLAVTFTARAAGEMRTRLRELGVGGVQARTFHAAALRQLHYFWPQAIGGSGARDPAAARPPVVAEAASRLRLRLDRTELRDLAAEIEWAKVSLLTPESYAGAARSRAAGAAGHGRQRHGPRLAVYEEVKAERGVIDFEDVLLLTRRHPRRATRHRPRPCASSTATSSSTSTRTSTRCSSGCSSCGSAGRHEVCVVGDPMQTIYSFTGASPEHLLDFTAPHPGARTVRLVRNYRSTPAGRRARPTLVLASPGGGRRSGAVVLQAQQPDGPAPRLVGYPDDAAEADGVARELADLIADGEEPSGMAVLFRTNSQSEAFEHALGEAGIPYLVRGGERFFARKEVREAIVLLRGAARGDDGSTPLTTLVRDLLVTAGWSREAPKAGASRERWESLNALAALADDLVATLPAARMRDLVIELDERAASAHAPTVQGVTLASLHAAKGLEWDTVVLAGCSDGLIPITMAETSAEIEEERRLLYVGVTRARRRLTLTWAAARTTGARASRRPSRFLDQAAPVLGEGARSTPKSAGAAKGRPGAVGGRSGRRGCVTARAAAPSSPPRPSGRRGGARTARRPTTRGSTSAS